MKKLFKKIIPSRFTYFLVHLKKTFIPGGFSNTTFSENGEDIILTKKLFKNKKQGFYVDVGAFHPKYISNTYQLHKRGWKGINIDPNHQAIRLFKKYRPGDINILSGVAKESTSLPYYDFTNSGTNTFNKEHAEKKMEGVDNVLLDTREIKCVPLRDILEANLPKETKIDLLDVDVENMDLEVLQSNDWSKYRPKVILVEDRDFRNKLEESPIYSFLLQQGYLFYSYTNITLIMCEKNFIET